MNTLSIKRSREVCEYVVNKSIRIILVGKFVNTLSIKRSREVCEYVVNKKKSGSL